METLYFAFGVVTMVLLAIASLAVYSTVKVLKLKNRIEEVLRYTHDETNNIYQNVNRVEDRLIQESQEVYNRMDRIDESIIRTANDYMTDMGNACNSYTDKRIDKLVDTYFTVKETEKKSK